MLKNCVGIDKDGITLKEAKQLKEKIKKEQKCDVILYKTKRGYHLLLIYNRNLTKKEDIQLRRRYGDCPERIRRSLLRSNPTVPYDTLFSIKNGYWRRIIYD